MEGQVKMQGNEAISPAEGISGNTFPIHLDNFDGPFDLLLQLISRHKLDITEISLAVVTDEFINYLRSREEQGIDLGELTEFLVVAATLLDLKAARLLPSGEVEDEEDLALLEARDLLFARLLQYRAFKEIASDLQIRIALAEKTFARSVSLEPQFATLLPEVLIGVGAERFGAIAARVLSPKKAPIVSVEHIHKSLISVAQEAEKVVALLRTSRQLTFRALISDTQDLMVVVARFLSLLELYRDGAVRFEQVAVLGELLVTWVGSDTGEIIISDEFDEPENHALAIKDETE